MNLKQEQILEFIHRYVTSNHEPPKLVEIGRQVGMSSTDSVHRHLVTLEREGMIRRRPRSWRGIVVTDKGRAQLNHRTTSKVCGRCKVLKSINEFGICRARKDGHNVYCKTCALDIVHTQRDKAREMKRAQREARTAELERKPNMIATTPKTPRKKVMDAISKGCRTRETIQKVTRLSYDTIGDVLADLIFQYGAVKVKDRQFVLTQVRAA